MNIPPTSNERIDDAMTFLQVYAGPKSDGQLDAAVTLVCSEIGRLTRERDEALQEARNQQFAAQNNVKVANSAVAERDRLREVLVALSKQRPDDDIAALLRRIAGSPDETSGGWQPIETAPKSKSDAGRDRQYVLVVYPGWRDGKPDPFVLMAYQDDLGWDTGTWRLHEEPTHWMPLPAPPSSSEKAGDDA